MDSVLKIQGLSKTYGIKGSTTVALDNIDMEVKKGDFLGVMGPSGAGKTTLLNLMSTIDKPTKGNIIIDGVDIGKLSNKELSKLRKDKIGFIFQDFNLLDNMTLRDNIALPLALSRKNHKEIEKKVSEIADFFGLNDHLEKYPYQLSGGQKQRGAAARALITSPSIIFADEPTGALDTKSSSDLLNCLSKLNEKTNSTIIMVTHDAFAASFCKKVLLIKDGKTYSRLDRNESRKEYYGRILELLASLGGGDNELF
ncbi:ABC transporter family protein [Clostridium argentinense CDC 2741]|uniref:ABC transporter family protein n=1 Tax=Clostridium argentinense CDC 2741 TaxID=1418104 RepID=A0A0C1U9N3_9CLOT|nr:ABC transporter ATP-binding protein [Clostridium argentinense]ARC84922.1 bacitracin ABC transporter ATP-binding protein [Clostridium argentinense]KIE48373.1 ABC transporter family protein [Clostridium argentinense CDC 2741]NFF40699.1 ABC transporter ATP-binding protein [Clostridium argentinense]NFP52245.1 ABC transporter ATP-binding protein [Clostridium argentinense]NFP73868.1 ABC transporter ATP-binding protein [Clostridium argentinense]